MKCEKCGNDYPSKYFFETETTCAECYYREHPEEKRAMKAGCFAVICLVFAGLSYLGLTTSDPTNPSPLAILVSVVTWIGALRAMSAPSSLLTIRLTIFSVAVPSLILLLALARVPDMRFSIGMGGFGLLLSLIALFSLLLQKPPPSTTETAKSATSSQKESLSELISDKAKDLLPEVVKCPHCDSFVKLNAVERKVRKFVCSNCNEATDWAPSGV